MKSLAALAALCLCGALAWCALGSDEALPHEPAAAIAPAAVEPQPAAEAPTPPRQGSELAALEPDLLLAALDSVEPDIILTGRVTPRSGVQPPVTVIAQSQCEPEAPECAVQTYDTEADPGTGEFAIAVGPGTWRLVARSPGFLPATEDGLRVVAGEELGDIVMLLERGERISGTVVHDGQPVENATVVASAPPWVRTTFTDAFGHYAIEGLPAGTYSVLAYTGGLGGDEKRATAGSTVHLTLGHREKIHGRVLDERGMPAEGAAIFSDYTPVDYTDIDPLPDVLDGLIGLTGLSAHGCGPSPACYQRMVTGADGRFELEIAPGETLTVTARLGERYAAPVDVHPGSEAVLELHPAIRVRVVDARSNPAVGAELRVEPYPRIFGQPAPADDDGIVLVPPFGIESVSTPPALHLEGDVPVTPWRVDEPPADQVIY